MRKYRLCTPQHHVRIKKARDLYQRTCRLDEHTTLVAGSQQCGTRMVRAARHERMQRLPHQCVAARLDWGW